MCRMGLQDHAHSSCPDTERMKWIVMWVGVFLASVVLFVAIPRPALLWVVNSLDVFGDGIGHVNNRTSSPAEPVSDGGDSVASRRTTGTFQADSVGRARVIAQPLTLVGESESPDWRKGVQTRDHPVDAAMETGEGAGVCRELRGVHAGLRG